MNPLGVVTGLEAEARLARRWGVPVVVGGGTAAGAAEAAAQLAPRVRGLISFGLAGGLDRALQAGDLVVPGRVVLESQGWDTNPALSAALGGGTGGMLLGGGPLLATVEQKQAARTAGAVAVDLESAAVAHAAARHGLPFAVLRAICDEAGHPLPQAALMALDSTGRIKPLRVLAALFAHPGDIAGLVALGRNAARARAALLSRVGATSLLQGAP